MPYYKVRFKTDAYCAGKWPLPNYVPTARTGLRTRRDKQVNFSANLVIDGLHAGPPSCVDRSGFGAQSPGKVPNSVQLLFRARSCTRRLCPSPRPDLAVM
jgi:hypothetical protein